MTATDQERVIHLLTVFYKFNGELLSNDHDKTQFPQTPIILYFYPVYISLTYYYPRTATQNMRVSK